MDLGPLRRPILVRSGSSGSRVTPPRVDRGTRRYYLSSSEAHLLGLTVMTSERQLSTSTLRDRPHQYELLPWRRPERTRAR